MKIYHNPQCSKSNAALELLQQKGIAPEIISYLQDVPTKKELIALLDLLKLKPLQLIRTKELLFKEKFEGQNLTDEQWIDIMLQYPELIERPIVVNGNEAVIGRPVERILDLL
jgi:arsenate reductase